MKTESLTDQIRAKVRTISDSLGLARPEPQPKPSPQLLTAEARSELALRLDASRAAWAKEGPKLKTAATTAYDAATVAIEKAQKSRDDAHLAYASAEQAFREKESAILGELKANAADLLAILCEEIQVLHGDLLRSMDHTTRSMEFYERQRYERATYKRAGLLLDFQTTVKTWVDLNEDQMLARFRSELSKIPSVDAIMTAKPAPEPPRVMNVDPPRPELTPEVLARHSELWKSGARLWHN